jgi:translation initiation factor IF-3
MVPEEAMRFAREAGLDLVEIAPDANPPVCKIIDFGKFLYQISKKEKQHRKKSTPQTKEIRLSVKISDHDYSYKLKHIREFLEEGNKVKVTIIFRGREIVHNEKGIELMERVIKDVSDIGKAEFQPKLLGRVMAMVLSPSRTSGSKEQQKSEEAQLKG